MLGGETVLAGNRRLLEEHGVDVSSLASDAERLSAQGQTPMYFARGGTLLGLISVADPRPAPPPSRKCAGRASGPCC